MAMGVFCVASEGVAIGEQADFGEVNASILALGVDNATFEAFVGKLLFAVVVSLAVAECLVGLCAYGGIAGAECHGRFPQFDDGASRSTAVFFDDGAFIAVNGGCASAKFGEIGIVACIAGFAVCHLGCDADAFIACARVAS